MTSKDGMAQIFNATPPKPEAFGHKLQFCHKKKYKSVAEAAFWLIQIRNRRESRGEKYIERQIYHCRECKGFYHLSSKE